MKSLVGSVPVTSEDDPGSVLMRKKEVKKRILDLTTEDKTVVQEIEIKKDGAGQSIQAAFHQLLP